MWLPFQNSLVLLLGGPLSYARPVFGIDGSAVLASIFDGGIVKSDVGELT